MKKKNSPPAARNKTKKAPPMAKRATKSPAFAKRGKPKIPALGSGMVGGLGGTGAQGMMP
jgi:hypothetical protein